jgi:hypothetical protein
MVCRRAAGKTDIRPSGITPNMTYLTTVLQGEQEVAVVTVLGLTRTLDPVRDQMRRIADSGQWPNDSSQWRDG